MLAVIYEYLKTRGRTGGRQIAIEEMILPYRAPSRASNRSFRKERILGVAFSVPFRFATPTKRCDVRPHCVEQWPRG